MIRTIYTDDTQTEINTVSSNYIKNLDCYEVELIKNSTSTDTTYRIELMDNDYINLTISELKALKELLNSKSVSKLILKEKEG